MASEQTPLLQNQDKGPPPEAYDSANDIPVGEANPLTRSRFTKGEIIRYSLFALFAVAVTATIIDAIIRTPDTKFDWSHAWKQALGGGLSGAAAMILQVLTLMASEVTHMIGPVLMTNQPIRTIMNYQYRYGTSMRHATKILFQDGGYTRFYSGLSAALIQGPVARFGDTAADTGIRALLQSNPILRQLPSPAQTVFVSLAAAAFRMILVPIDTLKTTLQTQGHEGILLLKNRIRQHGISSLWYGAFATAAATFVGNYPWFATYDFLDDHLAKPHTLPQKLSRQAFMGFVASAISDTTSNSLRVVKTYRQVHESKVSYTQAARAVVAADGLKGLFGRGLKTRIIANGLQGLLFSILWKLFLDLYVGFEDWKIDLVLFKDLDVCLWLQILNPTMSDPNFTVSLKASPFPYGIVALAQFVNVPVAYEENTKDDLALVRNGVFVTDPAEIISILASQGAPGGESSKTHGLLMKANVLRTSTGFQDAVTIFDALDDHLAFRTFFASHALGVVDLAIWGAIKGSSPALGIIKRGTHVHLVRWYSHLESLPLPQRVVASVNTAKQKKATAGKSSTGFVLDLPNAQKGAVVTRFPPEPSGYLHIGHAKAAMLNQYFAKAYQGKLIIRFDDTNPANEKEEFEQTILKDLELMEIFGDVISHSSDYFGLIYDYGVKIIKEGHAYADDTPAEQMKVERTEGIASKNRDKSVEENLAIFEQMKEGTEKGIRWCIRAKMSVDNPNKAMRDPVIYRCNVEHKHHRTGDKWKMYPTYDFTVPILDSVEGVTHALRANEYRDRNPQYEWFQTTLGLRPNLIWDFSRLNFNYTLLSKRKLRKFVEQGLVSGWDDPRFPTIRGLRRRGVTVEALRQYILSLGASQSILQLEWDGIWAINKKVIDPVAPRFYAVEKENAVTVTITGGPSPVEFKDMPRHKKNPAVGTKRTAYASTIILDQQDAQTFGSNEEITLMDWGNAIVHKIERGADGVIHGIEMQLHLEGDFKKTEKKISWLAASADAPGLIPATLIDFDYLITKKKIEENENWEDFITPQTEFKTDALVDSNLATLEPGTIVQFERKGFYILDSVRKKGDGSIAGAELFLVPDGKAATVTSKAGAKAASKGSTTAPAPAPKTKVETEGASTVSMYDVKPIYGDDLESGESTSVGVYTVKPVYD